MVFIQHKNPQNSLLTTCDSEPYSLYDTQIVHAELNLVSFDICFVPFRSVLYHDVTLMWPAQTSRLCHIIPTHSHTIAKTKTKQMFDDRPNGFILIVNTENAISNVTKAKRNKTNRKWQLDGITLCKRVIFR